MTANQIKLIRDDSMNKDKPLIIIYDNDKVIYDNIQNHFPIIWDDSNEVFHKIELNDDYESRASMPYAISTYCYDCVQQIKVGETVKGCVEFLTNKANLLGKKKKDVCDNLLAKISVVNQPIPASLPRET